MFVARKHSCQMTERILKLILRNKLGLYLRFLINALFLILIHLCLIADLFPDRGVLVSRSPPRGPFWSHCGISCRLPVGENLKIFDVYRALVLLLCDWFNISYRNQSRDIRLAPLVERVDSVIHWISQ